MKSAKKETRFDLIVITRASRNGFPTVTHAPPLATPILQLINPLTFK
jgi:hypothetical protein